MSTNTSRWPNASMRVVSKTENTKSNSNTNVTAPASEAISMFAVKKPFQFRVYSRNNNGGGYQGL